MNRKYDYRTLESEYVAGDMSVRELARRHGIGNASLLHAQARQRDWYAKREAVQQRTSHKVVERLSDAGARRAERAMEVEDHALEIIDEALTKMSADMKRTHMVERGGVVYDEPVFVMGPKEIALLIDRLQMFLDAPGRVVEHRSIGLAVTSELSMDMLKHFAGLTRAS